MTHSGGQPHTNVGDRGQRYELRTFGYPSAGKHVSAWAPRWDTAVKIAETLALHPECSAVEIFDRWEDRIALVVVPQSPRDQY